MAQKTYPRSLRSQKLLSQDYSFYADKIYPNVWAKGYELSNLLLSFSQKNLACKRKRKIRTNKRKGKNKKIHSFLNARLYISNLLGGGAFIISPILFKFAHHSLAQKYNPIKTRIKVGRKARLFLKQNKHRSSKNLFKKRFHKAF